MTVCPKCGKELPDGSNFCGACGTRVYKVVFCPACGAQNNGGDAFCRNCGASIARNPELPFTPAEPVTPVAPIQKAPRRRIPGKVFLFGGIGIVVIAAIVLVLSGILGSGGSREYALYLKDDNIVYTDLSENGSLIITSDGGLSSSDYVSDYTEADIGYYTTLNSNGTRIFFPEGVSAGNPGGVTLCCRDINRRSEVVEIDSEVIMYAINEAGTKIAYVKGFDRTLYISDLTDREKIADGVRIFTYSDDFEKISYRTYENDFYQWQDGESVKLVDSSSTIVYRSPDLSEIYFSRDGSLYKQAVGGEAVEIASGVSRVIGAYDSGEIYYTKANSTQTALADYVEDDMAESDAALTEPEEPVYPDPPVYPSRRDYDSYQDYAEAKTRYGNETAEHEMLCDMIRQEYEDAYDAYGDKRIRDLFREELQTSSEVLETYTLCYFDGEKETVITDALVEEDDQPTVDRSYDKPMAAVHVIRQDGVQKVTMSHLTSSGIDNADELVELLQDALCESSDYCIVAGPVLSVLEQNDAPYVTISTVDNAVYFTDNGSDDGTYNLYKAAITNDRVGTPQLIDTGTSDSWLHVLPQGGVAYFKNLDPESEIGDLFINGDKVDHKVWIWSVSNFGKGFLYYTNKTLTKGCGDLHIFENGKTATIAADVRDYHIASDNSLVYLLDRDYSDFPGTLYLYSGGKSNKLDDGVSALIPLFKNHIMGNPFGD